LRRHCIKDNLMFLAIWIVAVCVIGGMALAHSSESA
jgi:hypothetical protein